VRPLLGEAIKDAEGKLPPQFDDLKAINESLSSGSLSLNLGGETLLRLTLESADDEAAKKLEAVLGRGKELLKQAYPEMRKDLSGSLPPDLVKDTLAVTDQLPEGVAVSREGPVVTLTLRTPRGLDALVPKLAPLLTTRSERTRPPVNPGKPPPVVPPDEVTPVASLPLRPLLKPAATGDALKGETRAVMDVSTASVKLSPTKTLLCLTWADDKGSAFYALDASGDLRRVSYPDLKEEWKQPLGEKCAWMSLSSEGLLITLQDGQEVWLIDPARGEMKGRWGIAHVVRAASTASSSVAVASAGDAIFVLDLKKGTSLKYNGPKPQFGGLDDPVMTPDGKYLFTAARLGLGVMHRWAVADGKLRLEESSGGVAQGRIDSGVTVSPDAKFVCFPSYVGGGAKPPKNYTLSVFAVGNLKEPAFVLDPGGTAIGFDPAGGHIYTQNLRLFDYGGKFNKEYQLGGGPPMITGMGQILVHPAGNTFLMIGDSKVLAVTVPKK
jgi:hypothetical protein